MAIVVRPFAAVSRAYERRMLDCGLGVEKERGGGYVQLVRPFPIRSRVRKLLRLGEGLWDFEGGHERWRYVLHNPVSSNLIPRERKKKERTFLSPRKLRPLATNFRVEALRQTQDELQDVRIPSGGLELCLCDVFSRTSSAKKDVESDGSRVESRFLRHERNLLPIVLHV